MSQSANPPRMKTTRAEYLAQLKKLKQKPDLTPEQLQICLDACTRLKIDWSKL